MREAPSVGATVDGRYLLEVLLGAGGFGEVWRARDVRLKGRLVAIKFLKAEHGEQPHLVARFDAEADALALLQHPHVIGATDRGQWAGRRYLVTELITGISLAQWIDDRRAAGMIPDLGQVRVLFDQVCAGIDAAHAVRVPGPIVHRDLKPENVLLKELPDGQLSAKVVDFGIAQLGGRRHTNTGTMLGTPTYMAPEQAMGRSAAVGPATDVFSLAVMLVEMMTYAAAPNEEQSWWGVALERGVEVPVMLAGLRTDVPGTVWAAIARALRSRASERYADAGALRRALRDAWDAAAHDAALRRGEEGTAGASGAHRASDVPTTEEENGGLVPARASVLPPAFARAADEGGGPPSTAPRDGSGSPSPSRAPAPVLPPPPAAPANVLPAGRARRRRDNERTPIAVAVQTPPVPALVLARSQPRRVVLGVVVGSAALSVALAFALRRTREVPRALPAASPAARAVSADGATTTTRGLPEPSAFAAALVPPPTPPPADPRADASSSSGVALVREPAELPRPLGENPELDRFLRGWSRTLFEQQPAGLPDAQYAVHPHFRGGGPLTTAHHIQNYWRGFVARGGSFAVDWSRSTWQEEYAPDERIRNQCGRIAGAVGPFYLARVWAAEYAPDRPAVAPCSWLRGVYLLRLRRIEGALRICYESWSTREGLCASCPQAPACSADRG